MILVVNNLEDVGGSQVPQRLGVASTRTDVSKPSGRIGIGDIPPKHSIVFRQEVVFRLQTRLVKVTNGLLGVHSF
jgi:hypothetical protein